MVKLRLKAKLPPEIFRELGELSLSLSGPSSLLRLLKVLSPKEAELVGRKGIDKPAPPRECVSLSRILNSVATQRNLTPERALLDLARQLDFILPGKYEYLRRGIGEPVNLDNRDIPQWDATSGELSFNGKTIRRVSARAHNVRKLLDSFEEFGWPSRIDSPLSDGSNSRRLRYTVGNLNEGLKSIRFFCDGRGRGIIWQGV